MSYFSCQSTKANSYALFVLTEHPKKQCYTRYVVWNKNRLFFFPLSTISKEIKRYSSKASTRCSLVRPNLGENWGDSLVPLVEYFLWRGVVGPGGPNIISILAKQIEERTAQCRMTQHRPAHRSGPWAH